MAYLMDSFAPIICKDPKLAGHRFCGPISASSKQTLEYLEKELGELENSLSVLEFATEFSPHADKIKNLRGKIGQIQSAIANPLSAVSLYEDGKKLVNDIRRIGRFDPATDPVGTAKAYGAAMQSLGKLVQKLGPLASSVGLIIEEMGKIFAKVVTDIVPKTRQTNRNVSDGYKQGGVIIPGYGD